MKQTIRLNESQLRQVIRESVKKILKEGTVPRYDKPVFINCRSLKDAEMSVEIGYSDYYSSLFYVGNCFGDAYAAMEMVVKYLIKHRIIDVYAENEEIVEEYPDNYTNVNGYYFRIDKFAVNNVNR